MTLTPDEREAAIEKMARVIAGHVGESYDTLPETCSYMERKTFPEKAFHDREAVGDCATAALDAVLPLIERAVLTKASAAACEYIERIGNYGWEAEAQGVSEAIEECRNER